jgi:hypothetical protein
MSVSLEGFRMDIVALQATGHHAAGWAPEGSVIHVSHGLYQNTEIGFLKRQG